MTKSQLPTTKSQEPMTQEPIANSQQPNLDDTRPQPAIQEIDMLPGQVYGGMDDGGRRRGGCGVSLLMLGALGFVGVIIVALAAAAGWTTGQREAAVFATATRSTEIIDQLNRIPQDIANRNTVLMNTRLQFLSMMTPGIPELAPLSITATALYNETMPTATALPTATVEAVVEATAIAPTVVPPAEDGTYDLAALLLQAQTAVDTAQWQDAIGLLDAISGLDPDYEAARVRTLLGTALNSYASDLYNTYQPGNPGQLAQAIVITDRAETLGVVRDGLSYERNAAQLYLDARRAIGLDPFAAIRALERLYNLGQGRYYQEAQQELYSQYVALGDAQASLGEYCPAAQYFQTALNYGSGAASRRDNANTICAQATPIPLPGTFVAPSGTLAAPIGQVSPPGG